MIGNSCGEITLLLYEKSYANFIIFCQMNNVGLCFGNLNIYKEVNHVTAAIP